MKNLNIASRSKMTGREKAGRAYDRAVREVEYMRNLLAFWQAQPDTPAEIIANHAANLAKSERRLARAAEQI